MNSTLAALTQPRQEPVADLLPRGRRHVPRFQRGHPSSDFLAPRRLHIRFRRGLNMDVHHVIELLDGAYLAAEKAREDARPLDVWIAFNVPTGTHITSVQFDGKEVKTVDVTAK